MKKLIQMQFFVLLIGTVFAWTNFTNELFSWLNNQPCEVGCSATGALVNPFFTPCFYGAIFFTVSFVLSLMLMFAGRNLNKKEEVEEAEQEEIKSENIEQ